MLPDAPLRFSSAVPAWSIIALERARRAQPRSKWVRVERFAGAMLAPFSICFACVLLASISVLGWRVGIAVAAVGSRAATAVRRSSVGRGWRERAEQASREWCAAQLRREVESRLACSA